VTSFIPLWLLELRKLCLESEHDSCSKRRGHGHLGMFRSPDVKAMTAEADTCTLADFSPCKTDCSVIVDIHIADPDDAINDPIDAMEDDFDEPDVPAVDLA